MLQGLKVFALRKFYRAFSARGWRGRLPSTGAGENLSLPGPDGQLPARFYAGAHHRDRPLILYFHGGGWVIGDLDTHDAFCRVLSELSGCSVLSVAYRLAPEHPYPAAQDDALAALAWLAGGSAGLSAPGNGNVIVAGDSAGAHLACCTCLDAGASERAAISGCMLIYPVCDHYSSLPPSYVERARGHKLTSRLMVWFWDTYLAGADADAADSTRALPLHSPRLDGLPPTFLVTCEYDPLRDEGRELGAKLEAAGVALDYRHYDRASHGFACSEGPNDDCLSLLADLANWIEALASPTTLSPTTLSPATVSPAASGGHHA